MRGGGYDNVGTSSTTFGFSDIGALTSNRPNSLQERRFANATERRRSTPLEDPFQVKPPEYVPPTRVEDQLLEDVRSLQATLARVVSGQVALEARAEEAQQQAEQYWWAECRCLAEHGDDLEAVRLTERAFQSRVDEETAVLKHEITVNREEKCWEENRWKEKIGVDEECGAELSALRSWWMRMCQSEEMTAKQCFESQEERKHQRTIARLEDELGQQDETLASVWRLHATSALQSSELQESRKETAKITEEFRDAEALLVRTQWKQSLAMGRESVLLQGELADANRRADELQLDAHKLRDELLDTVRARQAAETRLDRAVQDKSSASALEGQFRQLLDATRFELEETKNEAKAQRSTVEVAAARWRGEAQRATEQLRATLQEEKCVENTTNVLAREMACAEESCDAMRKQAVDAKSESDDSARLVRSTNEKVEAQLIVFEQRDHDLTTEVSTLCARLTGETRRCKDKLGFERQAIEHLEQTNAKNVQVLIDSESAADKAAHERTVKDQAVISSLTEKLQECEDQLSIAQEFTWAVRAISRFAWQCLPAGFRDCMQLHGPGGHVAQVNDERWCVEFIEGLSQGAEHSWSEFEAAREDSKRITSKFLQEATCLREEVAFIREARQMELDLLPQTPPMQFRQTHRAHTSLAPASPERRNGTTSPKPCRSPEETITSSFQQQRDHQRDMGRRSGSSRTNAQLEEKVEQLQASLHLCAGSTNERAEHLSTVSMRASTVTEQQRLVHQARVNLGQQLEHRLEQRECRAERHQSKKKTRNCSDRHAARPSKDMVEGLPVRRYGGSAPSSPRSFSRDVANSPGSSLASENRPSLRPYPTSPSPPAASPRDDRSAVSDECQASKLEEVRKDVQIGVLNDSEKSNFEVGIAKQGACKRESRTDARIEKSFDMNSICGRTGSDLDRGVCPTRQGDDREDRPTSQAARDFVANFTPWRNQPQDCFSTGSSASTRPGPGPFLHGGSSAETCAKGADVQDDCCDAKYPAIHESSLLTVGADCEASYVRGEAVTDCYPPSPPSKSRVGCQFPCDSVSFAIPELVAASPASANALGTIHGPGWGGRPAPSGPPETSTPQESLASENAAEVLTYAESLCEGGHYKEAAVLFRRILAALQRNPEPRLKSVEAEVWAHMGVTMQSLDDIESAISSYRNAVSLDPSLHVCWANLATLHLYMRDYEEAVHNITQALALCPDWQDYNDILKAARVG